MLTFFHLSFPHEEYIGMHCTEDRAIHTEIEMTQFH